MSKKVIFPIKMMQGIFVNILDFMLTLDKVQNIRSLMCKSSKSESRAICKLFKLYIPYALYCISSVQAQ